MFRQTGVELEVIDYADEPELIRNAQIAMFRNYTGSPDGEPPTIERTAIRVVQVRPSEAEDGLDLKAGDLLMGIETRERLIGGGETTKLIGFHEMGGLGECFDAHATKEEHRWPLYVYRDGEILQTSIRIERVQ